MATAYLRCVGRVQGVFYRASTRDKARGLGLRGWVKNESNGDVLVLAQGEREKIGLLEDWCKEGPPLASVQNVVVDWVDEPVEKFTDFSVRY